MRHPPKTLQEKGRDFWKSVMVEWDLEESHDLALLEQAATCLDRIESARSALDKDGEYSENKGIIVAHPALKVARDYKILFFRAVKQLDLTENEPEKPKNLKKGRGY